MTDIKKARQLFSDAGLAFPMIPDELAAQLRERDEWLFSTREIEMSPYNLDLYVSEFEETNVGDYVVLSHSGHGVNSYALQYYIVRGPLGMFLHIGWGGVYMNDQVCKTEIKDCFLLADDIVAATEISSKLTADDRLSVVASSFYGSNWMVSREGSSGQETAYRHPTEVLSDVLAWLNDSQTGTRGGQSDRD